MKKWVINLLALVGIAIVANWIIDVFPQGYISASVIALFLGMLLNAFWPEKWMKSLSKLTKLCLQIGIILMGASLSLGQVFEVGGYSLFVMCFTLISAFGGGYLLGKLLGVDWKLSSLISAGTGICGGSAIAALSPVLKAEDKDVSYAISATFLFDILMVVLFPILGRILHMSDLGFGLWAGTAVNDTSSVVATGFAFSEIAGEYAVIVKLTRTLSIIPVVLIFSLIMGYQQKREKKKINISKLFPYFILFFLVLVVLRSVDVIPHSFLPTISKISKFLMVMALGGIGLRTRFKEMMKSGIQPMILGFLVSLLVVVVALGAQYLLGQV